MTHATAKPRPLPLGEKLSRQRQRQKLIDACISALHLHGPSRTTIDKVVAIAEMSPGIVNFYFETKAALLVAALEYLAVEFEEGVQAPVEAIRTDPVRALPRLIALYLDAEIASPRKVSVWYAFWGEANARQEYQEICGKRDQAFAELVRDLMARMIAIAGASHLNAESVALGLIGALEMTWQDIAFREEAEIDRTAARRRCQDYLASIFPGFFAATEPGPALAARALDAALLAGGDPYAALVAAELVLAGVPAAALPNDWLGYAVMARPAGQGVQRIVIVPPGGTAPRGDGFDWAVLITAPPRRLLVVPRAALRDGGDLTRFESNFMLSEA